MNTNNDNLHVPQKTNRTHTTAVLWLPSIPKADALTLHNSKTAGFTLTRTQMLNGLINREYARLVAAGEIEAE